jgi:hypothetical protein
MSDPADSAAPDAATEECQPCRGTGQVISQLGGSPSSVACPWCGGSGVRQRGIDAQAAWTTSAQAPATGPESAPAAGSAPPDAAA